MGGMCLVPLCPSPYMYIQAPLSLCLKNEKETKKKRVTIEWRRNSKRSGVKRNAVVSKMFLLIVDNICNYRLEQ